ncbi:MAG: hypothetical protein JRJ84_08770, partial [Deltaproteobacteria bacterium]|nr:hypothetical protein [Deltaproteobacteria bacterium]
MRTHRWGRLVLGAALVTGCTREPIRHPDRMSAWLEFTSEDTVADQVAFAASLDLNVNVAVIRGEHDRDFVRAACDAAEGSDVALRLWPLLPEEEGYWPNQGNAEPFVEWLEELRSWARRDCRRLDGWVVDLEMPIDRALELEALVEGGASVLDLVSFFVNEIDEVGFEEARTVFREETDVLKEEGFSVIATTVPMLADDVLDGDETIAMALWTPVEGIDWDLVSFQIYRSLFDSRYAEVLQDPEAGFTSGLVSSYAATAVEHYGVRAGIDLGTTGAVGIGIDEGLTSAGELQADIAAALAAGV